MRLDRLTIDDFALIAHAEIDFADRLTVVTGETGSGKTLLLSALGFALGGRANAEWLRAGTKRVRVSIALTGDDGEEMAIVREFTESGKTFSRINGVSATSGEVRALLADAVDIVGQHDQQRLLSSAYHLDALDRFAGPEALALRARVRNAANRLAELDAEIAALATQRAEIEAKAAFAAFAATEIAEANVTPGEDERLRERRDRFANAERIVDALRLGHDALAAESGPSAVDLLGSAVSALASAARFDPTLGALAELVGALQSEAVDAAGRIASELATIESDPGELEAIGERLSALDALKRKYGETLDAVIAAGERYAREADARFEADRQRARSEAERETVHAELAATSASLRVEREAAAARLAGAVAVELADLAMPAARFAVEFEPLATPGPTGSERAEFALAPNPGEPLRPLARSASGGELSRVLLALAATLADARDRSALVFDEIDAGIGGATAGAVGARLARLAESAQVVCVTHLAQIASYADLHYALRKREDAETTIIEVVALDEDAHRLEELARMLSGVTAGVSLEHARTLLTRVRAAR